ncbi:MAG TPA: zf-HC2 domain-containing protein [Candidatus Limnocylindrales bacterium]|nr:zf-HC2 domain-containing protein [Candidatus Limnocylindrales bacterium]
MTEHLDLELSAYLDGALHGAERAAVEAHVRACGPCAGRLAELGATARLIAALPSPRPSRSLVPRLERGWNWLRPLRSLSAVASGTFLFLFLASAVLESGSGLGGGGTGSLLRATSPDSQPVGAPAPAAPGSEAATASPPGDSALGAGAASPTPRSATFSTAPPPTATTDDAGQQEDAAAGATEAPPVAAPRPAEVERPSLGPPPLWLALGIAAGAIAYAVHRRLRFVRTGR